MSQAIRTARYPGRMPDYSLYTRTGASAGNNNWRSVLAKKIIKQAVICIVIVGCITWLQSMIEEFPQNIVSQIRLEVVEKNIHPEEIYQSAADIWEECVQYIKGMD